MFLDKISLRSWYLLTAIACAGMMGYALYVQYHDFLDPCPLCIIQRVGFMWIGAFALLAAIVNPSRKWQKIYTSIITFGALLGGFVAGRHVWMQHLPADQVPECGPGLNYMLENFPLSETFSTVFLGSGSCAEVKWQFLGLSMPEWSLMWFIGLGGLTLWFTFRKSQKSA